jgi:hypothetical protein
MKPFPRLARSLSRLFCIASLGLVASGCVMTVEAVNPSPNVTVSGEGSYAVDVNRVPDMLEPGRGVTILDVQKSVQSGFENAVGAAYTRDGSAGTKLVFDSFKASIDEGQIGILRVTYRARWISADGEVVAQSSGTALPKNPIQTGEGHWRDVLEVMFEQLVDSYDKAQDKREKHAEKQGEKQARGL